MLPPNAPTSSSRYASRIIGTGSAFPRTIVTNDDLSKKLDTSDEWIRERTGIRERRISEKGNPDECNSSLAAKAAMKALEMAGKTPKDIDFILYGSVSPDQPVPNSHCHLQRKLGAFQAWGLDVNAACSSFVFALATADQFLRNGNGKTALVIGAEVLSGITNWNDRGSCILFGDAAGAVVVERCEPDSPNRILSTHLGTDGTLYDLLEIKSGGSFMETTAEAHAAGLDKMSMKGRDMFKNAVRTLAEYADKALTANGMTLDQLDWIIPHQANLRIIEAVAKRLECPMDKVLVNVDRYGNTSSATVPTMLDEAVRDGRIKPGQTVLFDVFGAGLTYGSILVRM